MSQQREVFLNFYKHYIGDFQRDTSHLSLTERGAYLALMHHYYATEQALPTEHAALCRIAGAFSKPERDAVKLAMGYFELREGVLWHKRIEAELEKQEGRNDTNRRIALAREERKRVERSEHEQSTKRAPNVPRSEHEQSTPQNQNQNHSLRSEEEIPRKRAQPPPKPEDVDQQVWDDWLQLRKGKRAAVTPTVVNEARKEAAKASLSLQQFLEIWCARGTQGLQAEWLKPSERGSEGLPAWRLEQRARTQQAAPGVAVNNQPADKFFIEVEAKNVIPPVLDRPSF